VQQILSPALTAIGKLRPSDRQISEACSLMSSRRRPRERRSPLSWWTTHLPRKPDPSVAGAKRIGLDARAGAHLEEVEMRPNDVVGLPLNIAKRICDLAPPAQALVSESVKTVIAGSETRFI